MIVFCLAFGLFAGQMGPKGKVIVDFFVVLNDIIMNLVSFVMWYVEQHCQFHVFII